MDLDQFMKDHKEELSLWVPFGGFEIELLYTDQRGLEKLLTNSRERRFDRKTHQPVEVYSDERYAAQLATRVNNWRGLTLGKLRELTNIDIGDEDPGRAVPCTDENKACLIREIYGLHKMISDTITDLDVFRAAKQEEEEKNSQTSQGNDSG